MTGRLDERRRSEARKSNPVQVVLLNLLFYPLMTLWIVAGIIASPLCLVLCKLVTGWDWGRVTRYLIAIHGYGLIVIISPLVGFSREQFENVEGPCIMVVNHLSFFDSYFMAALPTYDIIFAVGAWPFKMYWYTLFMRLARYLDVEQGDWDEVTRTCTESFSRKGTVLFFPEGHRSRTGKLQPFYTGAFRLSKETGVPIVPLCITGTDQLLPPGKFALHPARVRLRALPPVDPAAFPGNNGHAAMRRAVREQMAQTLKEMQGESCL
ncbi:MAG TPA: 1-acyl-sn-glycerol-3-phosphate acyltransferase [Geobacter sp.]|nr:1-acyl-sn-glycerol-3-phosphate acyltransferase [Geobacter sp.]